MGYYECGNCITMTHAEKHKFIFDRYKYEVIILDVLLALAVLMNFLTLFMTNFMVVKNSPEPIQIMELNPITASEGNFKPHPESNNFFKLIFMKSLWWAIIVTCYVRLRIMFKSIRGIIFLAAFVLVLSVLLSWNFFNDLGYFIAVISGG